jgi:hypothetical protein
MYGFKHILFLILMFCYNAVCGQQVFVFNSSGGTTHNLDFSIVSSVGEPVTSVGLNIENGFLSNKKHIPIFEDVHFSIYPNPANEFILIEIGLNSELLIYNSIGQLVYTKQLLVGLNKLSVLDFADGLYYLMLSNEKLNVKGYKLLKQ